MADLLAKAGDGDFLRSVAAAVLQMLMEADTESLIGAGRYERTGEGLNYRNGFRPLGLARCKAPRNRGMSRRRPAPNQSSQKNIGAQTAATLSEKPYSINLPRLGTTGGNGVFVRQWNFFV